MRDLKAYLDRSGLIFIETTVREVNLVILRRLGGIFYIAAEKAEGLRSKPFLVKYISIDRDLQERRSLASMAWKAMRDQIEDQVARGVPPNAAVENFFRSHGTVPHTEEEIEILTQRTSRTEWVWLTAMIERSGRYDHSFETLSSPFGATAAVMTLVATAENWQKATEEEWENALEKGRAAQGFENLAAAAVMAREAREAQRLKKAGGVPPNQQPGRYNYNSDSHLPAEEARLAPAPPSRAINNRGITGFTRGTAAFQAPAAAARSASFPQTAVTGSAGAARVATPAATAAARATGPQARGTTLRNSDAPRRDEAEDSDEDVEQAFSEDAVWQKGPLGEFKGPMHRSGPLAGNPIPSLDTATANLSRQQRENARTVIGRFSNNPTIVRLWNACINSLELLRLAEVRRLWASGDPVKMQEARRMARGIYSLHLRRFMPTLRAEMEAKRPTPTGASLIDAALEVNPNSKKSAPFWRLADGTKVRLTVDHIMRIQDDPTRCVDPTNLQFSPGLENSIDLERIRNTDPFQEH